MLKAVMDHLKQHEYENKSDNDRNEDDIAVAVLRLLNGHRNLAKLKNVEKFTFVVSRK